MNINHYAYRVTWSSEDGAYIGTVAEFPSLSWLSDELTDALSGIRDVVSEVVTDILASGEAPPKPLEDRKYSGKFVVRVTPEVHRKLALEAAEQNVSLNKLAAERLVRT